MQIVLFDNAWDGTRGLVLIFCNYVAVVVCAMSILLAVLTHFGTLAEPTPDPKAEDTAE